MPPTPDDIQSNASTQKIKGTVIQYGSNPQGDIDKILVDVNNNQLWLHFPPHAAKQVLNIAKLHAIVAIEYAERHGKKDRISNEIQIISNNKNESVNIRDIAPPPPTPGNDVTVNGNKIEIKKDDNGNTNAFVLSNKLIMLPPHVAENLLPMIENAKTITVKGNERSNADGFVNINGLNLVRPDSIIIDGTNYLVR